MGAGILAGDGLPAQPAAPGAGFPDLSAFPADLAVPAMTTESPGPGKRVRAALPGYGPGVYHALYLPTDWRPGGRYPVIVEYAGNGDYRSKWGDVCTGRAEDSCLGYGLSAGRGCIWICLPYVGLKEGRNELHWWGDVEATVAYCKGAVEEACARWGGDPAEVLICGFSRGALACNYIGLHDDQIAALWRAFWPASHYDGARSWPYPGSDRAAAAGRLRRLRGRPVFVSHEMYDVAPGTYTIVDTVNYLAGTGLPLANFTFAIVPVRNHTDRWVLHQIPTRDAVRRWWAEVLATKS